MTLRYALSILKSEQDSLAARHDAATPADYITRMECAAGQTALLRVIERLLRVDICQETDCPYFEKPKPTNCLCLTEKRI